MVRPLRSWAPAAGAVIIVAGAAVAIPAAANASATLPPKSASQVLAMVAGSKVDALSGTIQQTSDLGLPTLPTTGPGADSSVASTLSLVTGTHTVRVYLDGATKQRVQVLDSNEEKDVIRNGSSVWTWDYTANTATHYTLPARTAMGKKAHTMPTSTPKTPAELATVVLAKLKSSSNVTVDRDAPDVAGRTVYDLILTPKVTDTLLGSVTIAVDSSTGLPLSVALDARGSKTPAVSVGFSKLTIGAPAASLFDFTAPSGAKVVQGKTPTHKAHPGAKHAIPTKAPATKPTVTGNGWDAVVTIPKQASLAKLESSSEFGLLTTPVTGGRLFHTTLVNVLFESDGRVLVGSVSASRLEAAAAAS